MRHNPDASCERCPLHGEHTYVPPELKAGSSLLILIEAPGSQEVREQKCLTGDGRELVETVIRMAGKDPETDVSYSFLVSCKPPGKQGVPKEAHTWCRKKHIRELQAMPDDMKVIYMGKGVQENMLVNPKMSDHGRWIYNPPSTHLRGYHVMPMLEPSYVLKQPSNGTAFINALTKAITQEHAAIPTEVILPDVVHIKSYEQLVEILSNVPNNTEVAYDIETDNTEWYDTAAKRRDAILMLQLAWEEDWGIVIGDELLYDDPRVPNILNQFFSRSYLIAHNGKYDAVFLNSHIAVKARVDFDTMLAKYLLDENTKHGLKPLSARYLDLPDYDEGMVAKYMKNRNDRYSKIPFNVLAQYGVFDVIATLRLYHILKQELIDEGMLEWPFLNILMPASEALTRVELRGVQIDTELLGRVDVFMQEQMDKYTNALRTMSNKPGLNPNSTQQMAVILYDDLKLPSPTSWKVGPRSTAHAALEHIKEHPMVVQLQLYRRVKKLHSSYALTIKDRLGPDGRVHANFLIHGTEVARLAVRQPALQTLPRGDDVYGQLIRATITAAEECDLIHVDYSQAELRGLAALSGDPFLIDVYQNDRDLHSEVAIAMFGPDFTKTQRVMCKMFNFAYAYGGTERSFATDAGLPITVAKKFVQEYDKNMPAAKAWKVEQFKTMREQGEIVTPFGRKRRFPLITNKNKDEARKSSVHMPVAATASDLTLLSLIQCEKDGVPIVLTVHDSILAEDRKANSKEVAAHMAEVMEGIGKEHFPVVPWKADADIAERWVPTPDDWDWALRDFGAAMEATYDRIKADESM